jgi:hypothetical protein
MKDKGNIMITKKMIVNNEIVIQDPNEYNKIFYEIINKLNCSSVVDKIESIYSFINTIEVLNYEFSIDFEDVIINFADVEPSEDYEDEILDITLICTLNDLKTINLYLYSYYLEVTNVCIVSSKEDLCKDIRELISKLFK